jgi:hypothetical protein
MTDEPAVHDFSRLDAHMASVRRTALLHASWRPMLAGAAGATLVVAAVYVALPKFSVHEVTVDHVVIRDVPINNLVPHDVPVNNLIPHDVAVEIPRIILKDVPTPGPSASAKPPAPIAPPTMGPQSPYAARTPDERKFVDKPEYKDAAYHGRIVKSRDSHELSFADGQDVHTAHWDGAKVVFDPDASFTTDPYVGDLGECTTDKHGMWSCKALHDGQEVYITDKPEAADSVNPVWRDTTRSVTSSANMVNVGVDLGYGSVEAMVDTGNSWPISMSEILADMLVKRSLAIRAGSTKSEFADGSAHDVDIILIKQITVEGRVLRDVEASVSHGPARILLGLGALNRLGPFEIDNGRIVFTGENQPT